MTTKKLTPKMEKEVTRNEIVSLFMLIRECKNGTKL